MQVSTVLKEKRNGLLEDQIVAKGWQQCSLYTEGEALILTVLTNASLLPLIIDVIKFCKVNIANMKGKYLCASMLNFLFMPLTGIIVNKLHLVIPACLYVMYEKGKKKNVLNIKLHNALYECMKLALLWFNIFAIILKKISFVLIQTTLVLNTR